MAERLAARFGTRDTDKTAKPAYAIVGMATRLPGGSESPQAFWEYLQQGDQQLGSLSASRFEWPDFIDKDGAHNGIDRACLINNVAAQDMAFFGISPKEAELMDPQQRILLELSWETLESAGHKPSALGGSTTGVFIGVCHSDYRELMAARARSAEAYVGTGNIPCMLANRVSYYYNFKGPSFTVDTACSSSLFAVAEAVNAIARGECEQALVGAINLILTPTSSIAYYQAGMLSSSASCNPFDDDSDGYLRAEGAGMILIKSLHLAQRDGDHIFGLVSGVAINHGGKARSLTAPSALAQSQVIAAAFERAGVPVDSVNYVETHGTGTPIGDPIEIHGLSRSFTRLAKQQSLQLPAGYCALGALKASVGHSEAAAGMAAIVKVLLAMHYRRLPPNHRLQMTNRRIELDDSPFHLVRQGGDWTPTASHDGTLRPLRAGISSFGFGGTNAHLLLEAAAPVLPTETPARASPQLFGLSARSDAALTAYARQYLDWLSLEPAVPFRLADLCHSVLNGREPLPRRLAVVAESVEQLITGLRAFVAGEANPAVHSSQSAGAPQSDPSPDALIATRDLPALARLWAGGTEVDFRPLSDESCRKLPLLPTYPFERKSYWVPWSKLSAHQGGRQIHALLHENVSNFRQQAYRSVFEPDHAMLTGHRVADCALLPGVAYLIMAQYALADALGLGAAGACAGLLTLREVRWLQPMAPEGKPLALELRLRRTSPQAFGFEFVDRHGVQACEGRAQLAATAAAAPTLAALPEAGFDQLSAEQCYASYRAMGLDYGPDYRVIQAIDRGIASLTAYLALPAATPEPLPVALLDGALQSCIVAVRGGAEAVAAALALPASVESVQVFAPCKSRMRAVIRLPQGWAGGDAQPFDIDLGNEQGRVCVRFSGVRVVRLDADVFVRRIRARAAVAETPPSDDQADAASVGLAASVTPAPGQAAAAPAAAEAVRAGLVQLVAALLRMSESDIDVRRKFTDYGVDSILAVSFVRQINARWNCKLAPTITFDCPTIEALALRVGSLAGASPPQPAAPVHAKTAVTGISAVGFTAALKSTIAQLLKVDVASIDEQAKFTDYGVDSIVAGSLTREINRQWTLSLKPTAFFDFPSIRALAAHVVTAPTTPIGTATIAAAAAETVRAADVSGERFVDAPWVLPSGHGYQAVVLREPSQIGELTLSARTEPALGDEDVVISVRAFSLNFGDLLCASGFYPSMPDYPFTPGFEAAGVVTAVGRRVEEFTPGDAVVALSGRELGAHANRLQCHRERIFHKPEALSFEEAAALPVVGLTVLDAFAKARPRAGERILIQTASGGVGLAAVQLAQHLGAEIYATAGSDEKLHYLRSLGIRHLINYRDSDFEQQIHRMTDGRGVDVVLNTLPGDALQKGLNCLSPGGRYVEIAMTALKSATRVDLSVLGDNQSFFSVNLFKLGLDQPLRLREHIARLLELQRQGVLRPVVDQVFPLEQYREACRYLADRRSIGKVVVRIAPELHYQPGTAARVMPSAQAGDRDTDVAIIGVSGRFAGSDTVEELWQHLAEGRDLVTAVTRWDLASHYAGSGKTYCDRGSFLGDIESFDPLFFGISGVEARHMDPQQRLLLEEAWHALEDAGHASDRIRGKSCGVFVGCTEGDYHYRFGTERIPPQAFWGNALSLVPARIAYHLDLHGPAVAVDTACSSSLVAVHQACQSLWLGEIDLAIAGGVFVQSTAKLYLSTERAEMLSHRGHCHAFGDLADGFVPGEGVGVIVLKRLAQARADGDRIHGVIRGSGIAQDGSTNGITAPSPSSQRRLQRDVYRRFGIDPAQIQLVEAHGTGTSLGDPIEFEALSRSFGEYTNERQYCALGSIKSSIGHLAPAAGIAGLIKVLLALRHGQIPPSLHCGRSNPQLDLANSPFYLSRSLHPWPQPATGRRMAAISSFGFSGTNAHLVVAQDTALAPPSSPRPAYLIVISAQSLPQLTTLVQHIARQARGERPDCGHLSHTLLTGRKHFGSRFACVVRDIAELADRLDGWLAGEVSAQTWSGECAEGGAPSEPRASAARRCVAQCIAETDAHHYASQLALLAAAFVQGVDVDYAPLSADGTFRTVSLPTYPFARQRFWVAVPARGSAFAHDLPDGKRHPLVHRDVSGADRLRYCSYFSGKERFFSDHRVRGQAQLSAAAQLEMAAAAVALSLQVDRHAVHFSDVCWPTPLCADGPLDVVITLDRREDAVLRFEIRSGQGDDSVVHAQGSASWGVAAETDDAAPDIARIRADATLRRFSAAAFYDTWRKRGIDHGVSHRGVEEIWIEPGGERLWAALALPAGEDDMDRYALHPGLLDAALQAAGGFFLTDAQAVVDPVPLLPFSLRRLRWYRALPSALLVGVQRIVTADEVAFDLAVHDRQGRVCLRLEGLQTRAALMRAEGRAAPSAASGSDRELWLRPYWNVLRPAPLAGSAASREKTLAVGLDAAQEVELRQVYPVRAALGIEVGDSADTLQRKLAGCVDIEHLLLVFTRARPDDALDDELIAQQYEAVRFLLHLVQALLGLGYGARALSCTLVTRRAQAQHAADPIAAAFSSLHGMAGSLAKEMPNWQIRLLDIDTADAALWRSLPDQPFDAMGNTLLYRDGIWHEQQLQRCRIPAATARPFRQGGVYVIVGGAGGIGDALSEHLVRHYQARMVWIGRRAADEHIERRLDNLGGLGPRPLYLVADAASETALAAALAQVKQTFGAVHGVVHSAIVLRDMSLETLSEDALAQVLRAKVEVSVRLAQVLARERLDFLLFFSSANAFLRAPGQSNYVAGCVFKDALAQRLAQTVDYPVKVINWGYWGSTGLVANAAVRTRMAAQGLASIEPQQAMLALEQLLAGPFRQLVYLTVNRPLRALGAPLRADDHAQVAPEAGDPMAAERALAAVRDSFTETGQETIDDSRSQIERQLLPLLWFQLRQSGLLQPQVALPGRYVIVSSRYERWLAESLRWLARAGLLEIENDAIVAAAALDGSAPDWPSWSALVQRLGQDGDSRYWLTLADETLRALPDILAERQAATEVLFPDASLQLVEGIYKHDRIARLFNEALAGAVAAYVRQRRCDGGAIRVLELGAGTGSSSEPVFARLRAERLSVEEYCYTDISRAFLLHAEQHYGADCDYLSYDLIDIERPANTAPHHFGRYDLVIAANVLHATRDIAATLQHAKSLLRRGGLLLINEISATTPMMHLTFGLLDGWWLAQDVPLRMPGGPALAPSSWRRALDGAGFSAVVLPLAPLHSLGYQLIVAQSDGVIVCPGEVAPDTAALPGDKNSAGANPAMAAPLPVAAASEAPAGVAALRARAAAWAAGEKAAATIGLSAYLCELTSAILDLERSALDTPLKPFDEAVLGNFGMDSLLSSNLRNRLLKELEVDISVQVLIGEKIAHVVEQIYQQLLLQRISRVQEQKVEDDFETFVF